MLFFFFQSDKQFSSCLGKKGLQHRTRCCFFFKLHSTLDYSSSLDESNQKQVFCFSSIAINTSHLQLSSSTSPSSAPRPSVLALTKASSGIIILTTVLTLAIHHHHQHVLRSESMRMCQRGRGIMGIADM